MRSNSYQDSTRGFAIVEALVGVAVLATVLFSFSTVAERLVRSSYENRQRIKAVYLSEEGMEAARFVRDGGWGGISSLANGTQYDMVFSNGTWKATTTRPLISGLFYRSIVFAPILRDVTGAIATTSATVDPDIRQVTVTVTWPSHLSPGATSTESIVSYLAKLFQ